MLFWKKKRNAKLKETLGLLLQFLWQRVQEAPAIPIALPPHWSLALQLFKSAVKNSSFPSYSLKLMLLRWRIRKTQFRGEIRSHSDHTRVQDKGWSWHWWHMQQRSVTPGHNYCPTFGSDRHRGLSWGLKYKDQIKESSLWILLRSPPCCAPKASQGLAMDDHEGIQSSSWSYALFSFLTTTSAAEEDVTTASELFVLFNLLSPHCYHDVSFLKTLKTFIFDLFSSKGKVFFLLLTKGKPVTFR